MIIILQVRLQEWSKDVRLARVEFFFVATSSVCPGGKLAMCWQFTQLLDLHDYHCCNELKNQLIYIIFAKILG